MFINYLPKAFQKWGAWFKFFSYIQYWIKPRMTFSFPQDDIKWILKFKILSYFQENLSLNSQIFGRYNAFSILNFKWYKSSFHISFSVEPFSRWYASCNVNAIRHTSKHVKMFYVLLFFQYWNCHCLFHISTTCFNLERKTDSQIVRKLLFHNPPTFSRQINPRFSPPESRLSSKLEGRLEYHIIQCQFSAVYDYVFENNK